jgi:hypothetical protein
MFSQISGRPTTARPTFDLLRLATAGAFCWLLLASPAAAQDLKQPLLAVYAPIVAPAAKSDADRLKIDPIEIARQAEEGLRATRRFAVYERSTDVLQGSVLREQDLAKSGLAKGNAAEFGKLENVQFIVQPEITELQIGSSYAAVDDFPGRYRRKDDGKLTVTFKLLDTTSGEIKFQTTQAVSFSRQGGISEDRNHGVGAESYATLAHDVAIKATNAIVNYVYPILVVRIDRADVYLNRGEGGGLAIGEVWDLESAGEDLIDPTTHESLGASETTIGRVRITRIAPRFSVAQPAGKMTGEIKPGDVLRPSASASKQ